MASRTLVLLGLCGCLAGCASLLPRGTSAVPSPFATFEEARAAAQAIIPFRTRTEELKALGFDPHQGRNVTLIPYPDVVARLVPNPGVPLAALDAGIRRCIDAQTGCRAFVFHFDQQKKAREGSFWLDFLNVRRVTKTTGWWFDALVVVSDDTVLFRNVAGQAHLERVDRQVNPLGPLQPAGEAAGAALTR